MKKLYFDERWTQKDEWIKFKYIFELLKVVK